MVSPGPPHRFILLLMNDGEECTRDEDSLEVGLELLGEGKITENSMELMMRWQASMVGCLNNSGAEITNPWILF